VAQAEEQQFRDAFVARIRLTRLQMHMSQAEFADHLGVSERSVYDWERGETFPSPRARRRLDRVMARHQRRMEKSA
jgi:DNA-binding transcriptional regulator YiaG